MATPIKISSAANTEITVGSTPVNLREVFENNNESSAVKNANKYMLYIENSPIRLLYDGNIPTGDIGIPVPIGTFSIPVTAGTITWF